MYLAGKLSKFEVMDWAGRTPKHSHWWDMYVEGISMDLLEGKYICSFYTRSRGRPSSKKEDGVIKALHSTGLQYIISKGKGCKGAG